MGSTVTTGKQVCAIRDAKTGTPIYILFEETYEKNCYPHTPSWSCICIGDIREALHTIFDHAGVCEGGMLQNRSGHITPEGYIQGWMGLFREPYAYPDIRAQMTLGTNWMDFFKPEGLELAKAALQGKPDALALLAGLEQAENGRYAFMLHENIGALADILHAAKKRGWGLGIDHWNSLEIDCRLGHNPKKASSFDIKVPEAVRLDNDERLVKGEDGQWRQAGWSYSVVGNYVSDLWEAELNEPGSYKKRIKAFREAIEGAPLISFPTRVRLDSSNMLDLDRWGASSLAQFIEAAEPVPGEPGAYLVPEDGLYAATHVPREAMIWEPLALAA